MTVCSADATLVESVRSTLRPNEAYGYLPWPQVKP